MEKIETRTAVISLYEKNLVWEDFKMNRVIDVSDIRENIAASLKLTNGARHLAVLDTRGKNLSITDEALKYGASRSVTRDRIATAHLTTSLAGRVIANFFNKFFRPKIHNRMFVDEKDALKWLRSFSA